MENIDLFLRGLTAIGVFGAFIVSAYGLIISKRNNKEIKIIKKETNGMKDELVKEVRAASFAKGVKQEQDRIINE